MQSGGADVLVVFDLDGTITRHDSLMPLVFGFLARHPWRLPRLLGVLPTAIRFLFGTADRGELKGSLLHHALGGLTRSQLEQWVQHYLHDLLSRRLFAEALQRIAQHRASGHHLVLMSASTDFYVPDIGAALGFDQIICTKVRWQADGTFDGRLSSVNCRGEEKARQLEILQRQHRPLATVAYGNSSADLPHMLLASEAWYVNGSDHALLDKASHIRRVRWRLRNDKPPAAGP